MKNEERHHDQDHTRGNFKEKRGQHRNGHLGKLGEIIDMGVELGIVQKSGSWFSYESNKLGQGRDSVKSLLRDNPNCPFNFLADVTCVDWHPSEPRFEVVYHLLSIANKERVRLKVKLEGASPMVESVTSVWPAANFFEREVFDLFGIRFNGHPYLRRIQMPEDWEGHPLRKDYPVEGYR